MSHDWQEFAERIRAEGFRLTPQRQLILDVVCEVGGHATATEVWRRVKERSSAVNRATVYRSLSFLNELRLLVSSEIGGRTVYEIAEATPHHHLVCRECGHIEGLSDTHVRGLAEHLLAEHGFEAVLDHLTITGVCEACRSEGRVGEGAHR